MNSYSMIRDNKTILLIGGTGFVGVNLGKYLTSAGYNIVLLTRSLKSEKNLGFKCTQILWDHASEISIKNSNFVAAINLAGESIATGFWTKNKKKRILDSRVKTTQYVVDFVNQNNTNVLIQASATGYYGDTLDKAVSEESPCGSGFLSEVVKQWESPLLSLTNGTRAVILRLGIVLGPDGGALNQMIPIYRTKLGACLGSGANFLPWIHISDLIKVVEESLGNPNYRGVYNVVSPSQDTFKDLHLSLIKHFGGVRSLFIPKFVVKMMFGEKSSLFLDSQKVLPSKLQRVNFPFEFLKLDEAVSKSIKK